MDQIPPRRWSKYPKKRLARRLPVKAAVVKAVQREIRKNVEHKYLDATQASWTTMGPTPTALQLSAISNGNTDITRVGDKVVASFLQFRYALYGNISGGSPIGTRVIVFQWLDNGTAVPTISEILEDSDYWLSPYKRTRGGSFRILLDKRHLLQGDYGNPLYVAKGEKNIKGSKMAHLHFNDTTTYGKGMLYVLFLSSDATYNTHYQYYSRFGFTDL